MTLPPVDQIIQLVAWFMALADFILALYILLLNVWNTANRHVSTLLLIFAMNNLAMGLLAGGRDASQIVLPTALLAATSPAINPALLITALVLLKPDWLRGRWRWIFWLAYGLVLLPVLLTLVDVGLGTGLWYTGLQTTYATGYVAMSRYTAGSLSALVRVLNFYAISTATLIPLLYIAILDRKTTTLTRRLAWLLLGTQVAAIAVQFGARGLLGRWGDAGDAATALITGFVFALAYAYTAFQQMISDRRLQRGRLPVRLTLLILSITAPLIIAVGFSMSARAGEVIQQDVAQRLEATNGSLYANTTTWLDLNVKALRQLVSLPDVASMDAGQQKPILQAMAAAYPHMYLVSTTDLKGMNVARSDDAAPKDYSDRAWFQGAERGLLTYQTLIGRTSGVPALVVAAPIYSASGEIVGVGMFAAELTDIGRQVQTTKVGETGITFVVDAQNKVVAHPDPAFTAELRDLSTYPPVAELRQKGRGPVTFTDENGTRWRAYVDTLDNDWGIVVQQPEAEALAAQRGLEQLAWLVLGAGTALLLVFVWLTVRQTLRPVGRLTDTANAIAAGDLTRTAPVESEDEFGVLARTFNSMTAQLRGLIGGLEERVAERTRDLERRSAYLEASAEVGRAATSILETDRLIQQTVELVRERFGLYYVGLFLVDESGEWAVLRAGTGEAGQAMLTRGHRIRVGTGMVGWSVAHGESRIALDVGVDAVRLATSELPLTRSEAALPLRSRGRVLGALTVQSTEPAAFDQDTIVVLETMADQVAVALDNARLFAESQTALEAARRAYGEVSREAWSTVLRARPDLGYRSDERGVLEATQMWQPEMEQAWQEGRTIRGDGPGAGGKMPVAIPIRVRGDVIGVLDTYKPDSAGGWTAEEIAVLETITEQLGVTLESARLFEEVQRRARDEQELRTITAQVRGTSDLDAVLRIAVQEVARALGAERVFVQLGTPPPLEPLAER